MLDTDPVDYDILARYWPTETWFSRVGTDTERNDWRARTPDGGPRGARVAAGGAVELTCCVDGEVTRG